MKFSFKVNGKAESVDVDPTTPLLYVLRNDLGLVGPRFGCGLGQCGACTVIIKGEAVRSCTRPMSQSDGAEITTLEGLASLKPVRGEDQFITAGNASQLSDGAASIVMMEAGEAKRRGLEPLTRGGARS